MDNEITAPSDIMDVKSKMIIVRGQVAMLDRDVAVLYGVETKHVNQAVKNNPGRFPDGYTFALDKEEVDSLRSKILTLENSEGRGKYSKHGYKVFTERGLYMLATVYVDKQVSMTKGAYEYFVRRFEKLRGITHEDLEGVSHINKSIVGGSSVRGGKTHSIRDNGNSGK